MVKFQNLMFPMHRTRKRNLDLCVTPLQLPITTDRFMAIQFLPKNGLPVYFINIYLPTTNLTMEDYRECLTEWDILLEWLSAKGHVVSCGDFNGQLGPKWGIRAGPKASPRGAVLSSFLKSHHMFSTIANQSCTGPVFTYLPGDQDASPSQLDHFILHTENTDMYSECFVHDAHILNLSDHTPITISLRCDTCVIRAVPQLGKFNWKSCELDSYKQMLRDKLLPIDQFQITTVEDIDYHVNHLQSAIIDCVVSCVPRKSFKPHVHPFWDKDLKVLHSEQLSARHIWINSGKPRGMNYPAYANYKKAKSHFAKAFREKQLNFYSRKYEELEKDIQSDTKMLWKHIRQCSNKTEISTIKHNGVQYNSPPELCSMWQKHFQSLLNEDPNENINYDSDHLQCLQKKIEKIKLSNNIKSSSDILGEDFTVGDVASVCLSLKNNKAAGYDQLTYECLKFGGYRLFEHLASLYNSMIRITYIPKSLKQSLIIPVYKGGNKPKDSVNSYRGISLTPVINKVFEKLVLNRIKPWLTKHNFPPPLQQAFREKTDCVSLSFAVQEAIRYAVNQGSRIYGCFMDIKSAFDIVNWESLLVKIWNIGIRDKLWSLFECWLQDSSAIVNIHGHKSESFKITRSIKQGGLLSIFYFAVFYNDLHDFVKKGSTQYLTFNGIDISSPTMADDTLLLSLTPRGLQTMLDNAYTFAKLWRFQYSPTKTKCMVFGGKKSDSHKFIWYLGDQPLEQVCSYTYLGIILSSDMTSHTRSQSSSNKGYRNLGMLKAAGFCFHGLSPTTCATIWKGMLVPSMLYGCEVWGHIPIKEQQIFESVQNRIARHIQGLHKRTHREIVRGLLGWHTIAGTVDQCKLNFIYRLMSLPHNSVIKHVFLSQIYMIILMPASDTSKKSLTYDLWSVVIKYDLCTYAFSYLAGGSLENKSQWKMLVRAAISTQEESKWIDGLQQKGAKRFLQNHQHLTTHPIYKALRYQPQNKIPLVNLVKLLAFPEKCREEQCGHCHGIYTDTVHHYVMDCTGLIMERNLAWGALLDTISCENEAHFMSWCDSKMLNTLLGKYNVCFKTDEEYYGFINSSAKQIIKLMRVVQN